MKWTYLYIILLFLSCQTKEEENRNKVNYLFTLEKTGELKLPLDNETSYEMYYLSYYNDNSEELLYTWNHFTNGINVYSLTTKTLLNQIKIPLEGPNSIYSLQGFTVIHKDTILAYARGTTSSTIMLNTKGDILNTHFMVRDSKMPVINHLSNSQGPTLKYGKYLCFSQLPLYLKQNNAVIFFGMPPYTYWQRSPEIGKIPPYRTDTGCYLISEAYGTKNMIYVKDVDGLYTNDPKKDKNAKFIPSISAEELVERDLDDVVVERAVIDMMKSAKNGTQIQIINGLVPGNFTKALNGEKVGTIITSK